jgi:hypothetical protein
MRMTTTVGGHMSEIKQTSNYKLFKFSDKNRNVRGTKVQEIIDSINEIGSKLKNDPIIVDENFVIMDGQHRFRAHEQLGLPIFYIKDDEIKIEDVPYLNHPQTRWLMEDYVRHYVALRNPNYLYLQRLKDEYKSIAYNTFCHIFNAFTSSGKYKSKTFIEIFRKGKFTLDEEVKPMIEEFLRTTIPTLKEVVRLKSGQCGFIYSSTYIDVLVDFYQKDEEAYAKLLTKLPENYDKLIGFTSMRPLEELFERILNTRKRRIRFDEEVA